MRRILIGSIGSLFALTVGCSDDPAPADASTADVGVLDVGTDSGAADSGAADSGAADVPVALDVVDASAADVASDRPSTDASDGGAACSITRALVTTTDFMNGGYGLGPIAPTPSITVSGAMSPDQDHVPVESGCIVYNLLRSNDAIAVLDPGNLPSIARSIPLRMMGASDAGAPMPYSVNPYDVLTLSPTRAVVVQYALPRLGVIDPSRSGAAGVTGSVDLTPLRASADMDGSLEASNIVRVGGSIFVSLQNLNSYVPVTNGTLAVINASDLSLVDVDPAATGVQPVQLTGRNPVSMVTTPSGASIVVAEAGVVAFSPPQSLDGRIERVDPATRRVQGMSVSETALGGDLGGIVMLDESRGWAIVSRLAMGDAGAADNRVVEFNLATGTVGSTIVTAGSLAGIARDPSGNVWVLDRTPGSSGVRVFRPDGTALTTMTLSTGARPPYGVAFVP
ncbi:MAG: hypothetical protein EPO40_11940 [Myxococcaceae bacterium]|nr:MAG: hypothetical protein EPO40_11940 [Myxococcaceae bacterium]